jgi:hypothetical protein
MKEAVVGSTDECNMIDFMMFFGGCYGTYWSAWFIGGAEEGALGAVA